MDNGHRPAVAFGAFVHGGEHPVVGADKKLAANAGGNGAASRTHAGVNHHHVDGAIREVKDLPIQHLGCLADILWADGVAEVGDLSVGSNAPDNAFHHGCRATKIGCHGYKGHLFFLCKWDADEHGQT